MNPTWSHGVDVISETAAAGLVLLFAVVVVAVVANILLGD